MSENQIKEILDRFESFEASIAEKFESLSEKYAEKVLVEKDLQVLRERDGDVMKTLEKMEARFEKLFWAILGMAGSIATTAFLKMLFG